MEPHSGIHVLLRRGKELAFSLSAMWGHNEKAAVYKPGRESSPRATSASTLSWPSFPCNPIAFFCSISIQWIYYFTKQILVKLLPESTTCPLVYGFLFSLELIIGFNFLAWFHIPITNSPHQLSRRDVKFSSMFKHISSSDILEMSFLEPSFFLLQSGLETPHPCCPWSS